MRQYQDLMKTILLDGVEKSDRTGTGTLSIFGHQMRFDLKAGFPLVTTKKMYFKAIIHELLWFLRGDTNVASLQEHGVTIWDEWADQNGELGPVYGKQWRRWATGYDNYDAFVRDQPQYVDQIAKVIHDIKTDPHSRRLIVSAWNVADLPQMALAPCHCLFQFYVANGRLSCQLYQRSADVFLGVPFNIASYALLTHLIAHVCELDVGEFIWSGGDCHLYLNHLEQARTQLGRMPLKPPFVYLDPAVRDIDQFKYEDISILNYDCHPPLKGEIAV